MSESEKETPQEKLDKRLAEIAKQSKKEFEQWQEVYRKQKQESNER